MFTLYFQITENKQIELCGSYNEVQTAKGMIEELIKDDHGKRKQYCCVIRIQTFTKENNSHASAPFSLRGHNGQILRQGCNFR